MITKRYCVRKLASFDKGRDFRDKATCNGLVSSIVKYIRAVSQVMSRTCGSVYSLYTYCGV